MKALHDIDLYIKTYSEIYISTNVVGFLRRIFHDTISIQIINKQFKNTTNILTNFRKFFFCNQESPVCEKVLETNRKLKPQFDNFIFKVGHDFEIEEDYFKDEEADVEKEPETGGIELMDFNK